MSVLAKAAAANHPVMFDASNKQHRQAYQEYVAYGKWSPSAPRFILEMPHVNVVNMVTAKVAAYYIKKEFKQ